MNTLITGFAGSLGSEFTQFCLNRGDTVVGIDNSEWAVAAFPDHERLTKKLGDFAYMQGKFDLVIHCAAYKHVDLIEQNQKEALYNNYAKTAHLYNSVTGDILFISTDKAVEPASFYGKTKQLGEELTRLSGGIVARLGNIIGSSGSVLPKWEYAIENDLPIPVTSWEMSRYLLEPSLAVSRVMSLLPKASPGDVIIPEMGAPVDLDDLFTMVLQKHGITQYPSEIIGIRPGEKMHEKLKWDEEYPIFTDANGIIVRK